jgi:hypothetical protein
MKLRVISRRLPPACNPDAPQHESLPCLAWEQGGPPELTVWQQIASSERLQSHWRLLTADRSCVSPTTLRRLARRA